MNEIIKTNKIQTDVDNLVQKVLQGDINPLDVYITIKKIEDALKTAKKRLKDISVDEAEKYGKMTFGYMDADITIKNSATSYDYSNIPEVITKELELKAIKERHKQALQHTIIDEKTGEILKAPIVKHGQPTLSIKLKK